MQLPPRIVRRVVFAPAMLGAALFALTTIPLWALGAAMLSPLVPGRMRPLRVLWVVMVYLAVESAVIIASFGLWLASGFGAAYRTERFEELHYRLLRWILAFTYRNIVWVLRLSIDFEQVDEDDKSPVDSPRPMLVFSRHAGPGDSFLLVHEVMVRLNRRPRIVLKDLLQLDPAADIILNRLPNSFVPSDAAGRHGATAAIRDLAEDMDERDALVLFPEGGNFSETRRRRAIDRLRGLGHHDEAESAEKMRRVLPPRPAGALAAIEANPETDILFIAHTGLEHMSTVADLWRGLPMDRPVKVGWWLEPEEVVPADEDQRVDWLFAHWARIDDWIEATHGPST